MPSFSASNCDFHLEPRSGAVVQAINSTADIPATIAYAEKTGAHHRAYLLRQRLAGRTGLYEVFRDTSARRFKQFVAIAARRPMLLVVGADDGLNDRPEAWPLAHQLAVMKITPRNGSHPIDAPHRWMQ